MSIPRMKCTHAIVLVGFSQHRRRRVPPIFRSIRRPNQAVILEWMGSGTLQASGEVTGPWEDLEGAISPQTITNDPVKRFFRLIAQ
jgi:hypothetical protein